MEPRFGSASPQSVAFKSRPNAIPGLSSLNLPDVSGRSSHCRNLFSPGPATVLSPVTNLALDMNNLAGLGRYHLFIFCIVTKLFLKSLQNINVSLFDSLTLSANLIPRKGEIIPPWRRFLLLPQTSHLMLVSSK